MVNRGVGWQGKWGWLEMCRLSDRGLVVQRSRVGETSLEKGSRQQLMGEVEDCPSGRGWLLCM